MMKTLFLSFFVSVCLVWGSAFAAKTQINIDNLPPSYESSTVQDWINLLESEGHLVNVPQDVIALWRGRLRDIVREGTVTNAIEAYNTTDAKPLAEIKTEYRLRGSALPEGYYEMILETYRAYEQQGDSYWLTDLENYKQRLAFLDTLTDEQWGYLGPQEVADFTDPSYGYDPEGFKELVGAYIPMVDVPTPVADFAKFYVFPNLVKNNTWPILLVVDNEKGAWEVEDQQGSYAELQLKFVADDGTETLLRATEFGTNMYWNIERNLFYIPPKSGRLWYRYRDFAVTSNSDINKDGDWAGGIAITHGYVVNGGRDDANEIKLGNNPSPIIPMSAMGNPDWDINAHFIQAEREYEEASRRLPILRNEINPLREKMGAALYPEDFYSETLTNKDQESHKLDPAHVPQWALDGQARLLEFFGKSDFVTVMYGIRSAVESKHGYGMAEIAQTSKWSAPTDESSQQYVDHYNKWLASETERKARLAKRRAEIAAKRAGTVEETSWEWEKRLNDELVAAKMANDQTEVARLEAELAAGYSPVATNQQQPQNQQQGTPPAQNQQGQQVQGGQGVQGTDAPQEGTSVYVQVRGLVNKLRKALKKESLFDKADFTQLEKSIKDNNMPQVFAKLDGYEKQGGKKVNRAVKRLRKMLKSVLAVESLNS